MSFADDVEKFTKKTGIKTGDIVRSGVLEISREVIRTTPRKTGAARNNWSASIGRSTIGGVRGPDESGAQSLASLEGVAASAPGNVFYMVNNLPYVTLLEYGSSKQAPLGMVRRAVKRYRLNLKKRIRNLTRGY